ncbi:MAG: hypothetical protein A2014_04430 [Spirochaetes bacterium GWF1_49_6]|nr:MAG: hypothetical protein A2014_04430 [Spirochaetes bacterium GWF1_49_6]
MIETSQLLLFISADLVGSTSIKSTQVNIEEDRSWIGYFKKFYLDLPFIVNENLKENNLKIDIWKFNGDEILFKAVINRINDIKVIIGRYIESVREFQEKNSQENSYIIKTTIWTAGFPVINKEVTPLLRDENSNNKDEITNPYQDYIGPSIDAGFRLTKFADPNKIVLSIELAYIVAKQFPEDFKIFYSGNEILKGILKERPYPIFFLSTPDKTEEIRNKLIGAGSKDSSIVTQYIKSYIHSIKDPFLIVLPYLISSEESFGEIHPIHQQFLDRNKRRDETMLSDPDDIKNTKPIDDLPQKVKTLK